MDLRAFSARMFMALMMSSRRDWFCGVPFSEMVLRARDQGRVGCDCLGNLRPEDSQSARLEVLYLWLLPPLQWRDLGPLLLGGEYAELDGRISG
jgi:hypothetical protein